MICVFLSLWYLLLHIIYSKVHVFRIDLQGQKETSFFLKVRKLCVTRKRPINLGLLSSKCTADQILDNVRSRLWDWAKPKMPSLPISSWLYPAWKRVPCLYQGKKTRTLNNIFSPNEVKIYLCKKVDSIKVFIQLTSN